MSSLFNRLRFGTPQFVAGALLLFFVAECVWLIAHNRPSAMTADDFDRVEQGIDQWQGRKIAGLNISPSSSQEWLSASTASNEREHSPLWYLAESAPLALFHARPESVEGMWLVRIPYLVTGVLLGASLWYVSRRLYGNAGAYIALVLYCFSPTVIRASALWFAAPTLPGAWGGFGAVFTAISVAHTLYAPREVVLWNWRRILLLGISLALAVGWHFALVLFVPLLLGFMFYLAPTRRTAATVILLVASSIALLILLAGYWFHPACFWYGVRSAWPWSLSRRALTMGGAYWLVFKELADSAPVLVVLAPGALVTYIFWRRTRYFGNTAPLIVAVIFLALRVASPHEPLSVFALIGLVFLLVFVAGIAADLLETPAREVCLAVVSSLLAASAIWNLVGLARIGR
jgi:hypothetical protein